MPGARAPSTWMFAALNTVGAAGSLKLATAQAPGARHDPGLWSRIVSATGLGQLFPVAWADTDWLEWPRSVGGARILMMGVGCCSGLKSIGPFLGRMVRNLAAYCRPRRSGGPPTRRAFDAQLGGFTPAKPPIRLN